MASAHICSPRMVKSFQKFNNDLEDFRKETGDDFAILYEDAYTSRNVKNFRLTLAGTLTWTEQERMRDKVTSEREKVYDDDDAREWLSFWRACLRRAKRYWSMDTETLDRIQDPEDELEDKEE